MTFVDISAIHADFLQFYLLISENYKNTLFEPRQPAISQCSSIIQNWLHALSLCSVMLEKYNKLQPMPKITDELKPPCRLSGEKLPEEHVNKAVVNFTKRLTVLTAYMAMSANVVTLSICNNSVHLRVCILILSPTNQLLSCWCLIVKTRHCVIVLLTYSKPITRHIYT